jgi:hypothetical protein
MGQNDVDLHTLENIKKEKLGDKLMKEGSYYSAIDYYKEILESDTSRHDIELKIGNSYFQSRDYVDAEIYYKLYISDFPSSKTLARYNYAECLRYNEKYQLAKVEYKLFRRVKYFGPNAKTVKKLAIKHGRSCDYALNNLNSSSFIYQKNLGDSVNSGYSDFSPTVINDTLLVFSSLRSDTILHTHPGSSVFYPVQLYQTKIIDDGKWGDPELIETVINKDFQHTANPAISPDKEVMVFTWCKPHHAEVRCHLYRRDWLGDEKSWSHAYKIHHKINRPKYTSTMPTIGHKTWKKGKKQYSARVLYFVSNTHYIIFCDYSPHAHFFCAFPGGGGRPLKDFICKVFRSGAGGALRNMMCQG